MLISSCCACCVLYGMAALPLQHSRSVAGRQHRCRIQCDLALPRPVCQQHTVSDPVVVPVARSLAGHRRHARALISPRAASAQESPPSTSSVSLGDQLLAIEHNHETPVGRVVIRALQAADTTAACMLLTRAFLGTPEEVGLLDATKYIEKMVKQIPQGIIYFARLHPNDPSLLPPNQDSRPVGMVALSLDQDTLQQVPTLPPPSDTAYLSNMVVDAKFRRMGIARALLHVSDIAVKASGLQETYLHVRQADAAAQALYVGSGYEEVSRDSFLSAQLKKMTHGQDI